MIIIEEQTSGYGNQMKNQKRKPLKNYIRRSKMRPPRTELSHKFTIPKQQKQPKNQQLIHQTNTKYHIPQI